MDSTRRTSDTRPTWLAAAILLIGSLALSSHIPQANAQAAVPGETTDAAWGYYPTAAFPMPAGSERYLTPDQWPERFPVCGGTSATGLRRSGNVQSPIDFSQVPVDLNLRPLNMRTYLPFTGISLEAIPQKQLRIRLLTDAESFTRDPQTNVQYTLEFIDVRSPSEHTFGGSRRDLELQFVHRAVAGQGLSPGDQNYHFAISVTYMVGEGSQSGFLDSLFVVAIPYMSEAQRNGQIPFNYSVSRTGAVVDMPPISRDYFRYEGSMTMPPCTENVVWAVYANPIYMGETQLQKIRALIGLPLVDETQVYALSGETGEGDAMDFKQPFGNSRSLSFTPESLQPLMDEGNIYSEQKYATTAISMRKRLFSQTEIRNVRMYKEYVGDEWLQHEVESLAANDVGRSLAIAGICCACGGTFLAVVAWIVSRA